ncbi:MAG: sulfatase-like hydrolase/transferase [Phycisphaerae bacterium]|nr:sulfatase-like hydrolase/transferase [Phycisphaerae bacterium]
MYSMNRRSFLRAAVGLTASGLIGCNALASRKARTNKPNIILVMADDLGYGDVQYNGNAILKTPSLNLMAKKAVKLNRFYAAGPVCSPTRASCLTGRHPYRINIPWAGDGHMPAGEMTIAETLKDSGYTTGHFGKWHVGALSKTVKQSYFPGQVNPNHYSPPWENGFDECFSTESMMPTYNPYYQVGGDFGTDDYLFLPDRPVKKGQRSDGFRWRDYYWTGPGQMVDEWLEGDDSKIVMDRALEFIDRKQKQEKPFLSLIWFHTPHTPVVAGDDDRAAYPDQPIDAQHWFGAITAMDRQIGRLREELKKMGIADNTIVWFCSDNGPSYIHNYNSAGPLRGKKATLWEGGIRVPAIIEWPARLKARTINAPMSTSDFYPTLLAAVGVKTPAKQPLLDGIDVMDILQGKVSQRPTPIGFQSPLRGSKSAIIENRGSAALIDNQCKLITFDAGQTWQLYDLENDINESNDIADKYPQRVKEMAKTIKQWQKSCLNSSQGHDYK